MARIIFISNMWYESLAIMQLSSVLKEKGHLVYLYMDDGKHKRMLTYIDEIKPDFIAFSLMTGQHAWALNLVASLKRDLRQCKPLAVFGGPHPTFVPEIIGDGPVDIICRGEGEGALLDLMDAVDQHDSFDAIPNLWVKKGASVIKNKLRPLIPDLNVLPFSDRKIFSQYSYYRNSPQKMFMASRGCPFNCSFCFNQKYRELYKGQPPLRRRDPDKVVEEIKRVVNDYKTTKMIRFQDDVFTLDKGWLYHFLDRYKTKIGLPFYCHIRAGIDGEDVIEKLSWAGCFQVGWAVETGNERIRNELLGKPITDQEIRLTASWLKKHNISFHVNNMFFLPGCTRDDIWKTVKLNQAIRPDGVFGHIFQPYPGTAIAEELARKKLIKENGYRQMEDIYSDSVVKTQDFEYEMNIFNFFYILVKAPWMSPFIDLLARLKPNIIFEFIYKISAGYSYWRSRRMSFTRFVTEAFFHYRFRG